MSFVSSLTVNVMIEELLRIVNVCLTERNWRHTV